MIHNYLDPSPDSTDSRHWSVGASSNGSDVLLQLGDDDGQVRLVLTPAVAREIAGALLAAAALASDSGPTI